MKIAIYGNNLNQGYWLARNFRKHGCHAVVITPPYLYDQEYHAWWSNSPLDQSLIRKIDVSDLEMRSLDPLRKNPKIVEVYDEFKDYDILFLVEDGPAFFSELNGPVKVFRAAGDDLQAIPFYHKLHCRPRIFIDALKRGFTFHRHGVWALWRNLKGEWDVAADTCARHRVYQDRQRAGLRQCAALLTPPDLEHFIRKLGLDHIPRHYISWPMDVENLEEEDADFTMELEERYRDVDVILFHPSRIFFLMDDGDVFKKGNDKLIRAYAQYLRKTRKNVRLVLIEKGRDQDIAEAKRLEAELGLQEKIDWIPELPNIKMRSYYKHPNTVVCGYFEKHIQRMSNSGREATFYGNPLVTGFGDFQRVFYGDDMPPNVIPAIQPYEIVDGLVRLEEMSTGDRQRLRDETRAWFYRHLTFEAVMPRYLELFERLINEQKASR